MFGSESSDVREICHKLLARMKDYDTRRGPVSDAEWDEMVEDVAVLKRRLGEAETAVKEIYSSLRRQLWDREFSC